MIELTKEDRANLKKQGYTDEQIEEALKQANELQQQQQQQAMANSSSDDDDPRYKSRPSAFQIQADDNLIRWQLELNDILERAEHILRGDVPKYEKGVLIWADNPYPEQNPLNEWGVQEIMKILAMYINRNTILSDYDNSEINAKIYDFGRRLNALIFMRYDELGMNNDEKRKNYDMIVGQMVDLVHSAYKRALHGGERRSLREMINISQAYQGQINQPGFGGGEANKERSLINPMRYLKGRYV